MYKFLLIFLLAAVLNGCQSIPSHKVQGSLDNGIYTSKAYNFSVKVPFDSNSPNYEHMHIKEEIYKTYQYQSFGPAMFDRHVFRLLVLPKTSASQPIDFEQIKQNSFNFGIKQIEQAYKAKATLISDYESTVNGYQATSRVYRQPNTNQNSTTVYHALDFVEYPSHYVLFWVEKPLDWVKHGEEVIAEKKLEKQLIKQTYKRQNEFISSFNFLEKTNYTEPNTLEVKE